VTYTLAVVAIHPPLAGLEQDVRFDGFRRSFLNIFQINPRLHSLANNASSDTCGLCFFEYSEVALHAPPLAEGLTCLDLLRLSLDRVLDGALTYGQAGYKGTPEYAEAAAWGPPHDSLDTTPSVLIAVGNYVLGAHDRKWAAQRFDKLAALGRAMLAKDQDGNGLIEYEYSGNAGSWSGRSEMRPANWWDTIGFGHEDAYSNALAYRACQRMADVAGTLGRQADREFFAAKAGKLRAAYFHTFFNPQTGVLAGWKSADGKLHDYWFTGVNGMAISLGLVDDKEAHAIMDRLLGKMREVGYSNFSLGLPGNLIPVRREDYTDRQKRFGGGEKPDGSDGFQFYENGGATACHAYWTIKALYKLGRKEEARRIFFPMLKSFADGSFQGVCANGYSKDWKDWSGGCWGYEGFLSDGYLTLLAVFDELGK
jgi:glycogen debranching enzyme